MQLDSLLMLLCYLSMKPSHSKFHYGCILSLHLDQIREQLPLFHIVPFRDNRLDPSEVCSVQGPWSNESSCAGDASSGFCRTGVDESKPVGSRMFPEGTISSVG
jgi:hypothetical protein